METKSLIQKVYEMDKETLQKYCIRLLIDNAEYFRRLQMRKEK